MGFLSDVSPTRYLFFYWSWWYSDMWHGFDYTLDCMVLAGGSDSTVVSDQPIWCFVGPVSILCLFHRVFFPVKNVIMFIDFTCHTNKSIQTLISGQEFGCPQSVFRDPHNSLPAAHVRYRLQYLLCSIIRVSIEHFVVPIYTLPKESSWRAWYCASKYPAGNFRMGFWR